MVACWEYFSRVVHCGLTILVILLCTAPLATPLNIERAYIGAERGMLGVHTVLGAIRAIVDSGATSTAVPEHLADLVYFMR